MTEREIFIALVDNDLITKSDAIVLLEGDGNYRISKAVDLYKSNFADKLIFSGGVTDYSYGSFPFKDLEIDFLNAGLTRDSIILEEESQNTYEQAQNVLKIAKQNGWSKIILVATHDHQYRAYLTFLKQLFILKFDIILINSPARNLPWFSQTGWGTRFERLESEFQKIEIYQKKNHLCSFKEAIEYQKWKESKILELI
jgi:hypothetical protein